MLLAWLQDGSTCVSYPRPNCSELIDVELAFEVAFFLVHAVCTAMLRSMPFCCVSYHAWGVCKLPRLCTGVYILKCSMCLAFACG